MFGFVGYRRVRRLGAGALLAAGIAMPGRAVADADDVVPRVVFDSVVVTARRLELGRQSVPASREDLHRSLEALGLQIVRRGVGLANDLYADGFRRGDISVTVDGERYHAACPNRMDPPTSLAIPVDVSTLSWDRRSTAPASGLGGHVALERRVPGRESRALGLIEGDLVRSRDGSASFALESRGQRLSGRWTSGRSYADGGGSNFRDRYGYRDADVRYEQGDLSWRGAAGAWTWGAQGGLTRDVPFAYLQMDERVNELWGASLGHAGTRAYVNRTRHLMDNGLRAPRATMSTASDQVTGGVAGRAYGVRWDAFARAWNANNTILTPATTLRSHLMPRYRQVGAVASREALVGRLRVDVRLGFTRAAIADGAVLPAYRLLDAGAGPSRGFVPFTLGIGRFHELATGRLGWSAEVASEPPSAEQMWIVVRRPVVAGSKRPDWIGAPGLAAPIRASLRGEWRAPHADAEVSGSFIDGSVLPSAVRLGGVPYQTYANEDAALLSARAVIHHGVHEAVARYTLGWNLDRRTALAEIAPFEFSFTSQPALGRWLRGMVRVSGAGRQTRVDPALGELGTAAWGRLDLGATWHPHPELTFAAELVNVTDALHAQHLSYLRDPFASGFRVTEPGRTVRVALTAGR